MALTAVVLAGGPCDAIAQRLPGAPNKAFVPIAGVPMVTRVLAALRAAPSIARIIVVAPVASHTDAALVEADERRPDGTRMADSLRSGLAALPADETTLIVPSDLPLLTPVALEAFLDAVRARECDLAYACLERSIHEAAYPGAPHTWARLREGRFCGGGAIAMKPRVFVGLERFLDRLGAARKNPLRLAALLGWDVLARFAVGRLGIADAEARATHLLGAPTIAVPSTHAEIAFNVDRVTDVALAERFARLVDGSHPASRIAPR